MEKAAVAASPAPRTRASLTADLRELGLRPGATFLVHSSLSSLGWVCGFEVAVIEALLDATGDAGTIAMPAFSSVLSDPARWENPPIPEAWWETVRREMPAFDAATFPAMGVGRIPEAFRAWPGVVRSAHPAVSFCARGPRAAEVVGGHALDFGFGEGSPLARLYDLGAQVLLLGVGYDRCSCFHLAEHRAPGAVAFDDGAPVLENGRRVWKTLKYVEAVDEEFPAIGAAFERAGGARVGPVGSAAARLFPIREAVDFAAREIAAIRAGRKGGRA